MREHPFEFRLSFFKAVVGKGGEVRNTALESQRSTPLRANCPEGGGKRARREWGPRRSQEAAREGARAPLFQQCGGVARTPASAAGRGLRQWGKRWRWRRRQWQLCGRLRPGLLDGGVAEAPP